MISIGLPFDNCCPSDLPVHSATPFIAPFWSDGDTRQDGEVHYEVHQKDTEDSFELLANITFFINLVQSSQTPFIVWWALIAEWRNVPPFPHGYEISNITTNTVSNTYINLFNNHSPCCIITVLYAIIHLAAL